MGITGSGKTSVSSVCPVTMIRNSPGCFQLINLASGSNLRVRRTFGSCTDDIELAEMFTFDGRPVVLIDTPAFDHGLKSDADILNAIAVFLATT